MDGESAEPWKRDAEPGHPRRGRLSVSSTGPLAATIESQKEHPLTWQAVIKRAVLVAVADGTTCLVFLAITEVLASWPWLSILDPPWLILAVAFQAAHFTCTFALQDTALRTKALFPVITSQLAGNAITPTRLLVLADVNSSQAVTGNPHLPDRLLQGADVPRSDPLRPVPDPVSKPSPLPASQHGADVSPQREHRDSLA